MMRGKRRKENTAHMIMRKLWHTVVVAVESRGPCVCGCRPSLRVPCTNTAAAAFLAVHCMRQCKHTIGIRTHEGKELGEREREIINEIWEPLASDYYYYYYSGPDTASAAAAEGTTTTTSGHCYMVLAHTKSPGMVRVPYVCSFL